MIEYPEASQKVEQSISFHSYREYPSLDAHLYQNIYVYLLDTNNEQVLFKSGHIYAAHRPVTPVIYDSWRYHALSLSWSMEAATTLEPIGPTVLILKLHYNFEKVCHSLSSCDKRF